jgi:hypothetical protein
MLTFNDIKTALISDRHVPSRVNLTLSGVNVPISGVRTLSGGEIMCIPVDKTAAMIQVTAEHTITTLP